MHYRPAQLEADKLHKLQALETELGKTVVAVETPASPATISDEQLNKLKQTEADLGVVLVAYESDG